MTRQIDYEEMLIPELDELGLELVKLRVGGALRQPRLTVFVDRVGGVTVGECVEATKRLRRHMTEKLDSGIQFSLNVSSPGTDRPLENQRDFHLVTGKKVRLIYRDRDDAEEQHTIEGEVVAAEEAEVSLMSIDGGKSQLIPYDCITSARILLPY